MGYVSKERNECFSCRSSQLTVTAMLPIQLQMPLSALGKPEAALNLRDATLAKIPSTEKNKSEVIEVSFFMLTCHIRKVVAYGQRW